MRSQLGQARPVGWVGFGVTEHVETGDMAALVGGPGQTGRGGEGDWG